jgi:hypothetical protein
VRLEEESRKSKPRRRGVDLRIPDGRFVKNQTPECGVKFHARISSSTVCPRNVQVSRDVDRPVTIKARVIENIFCFREASASFQAERFFCSGLSYRSAGDLACKRPVRPITVFFVRVPVYFISLSFVSSSAARLLSLLEFSFSFGKRGEARGNGPADRGRRRKIASRTISGFTFVSPFFSLIFVFESHLLYESFFFIAARAQPFILQLIIECQKRFCCQIIRFLRVQD